MPTGIVAAAALFCVLVIPMWSMAVPRLTGTAAFGEGASNLTTAVSAVVVLLLLLQASKLFDVVTSDTWHGSRLM